MNISKKGSTLIEAIILTLIIAVGVIGTFGIFTNSMELSDSTVYRLQAIAMAKEAIEGVTNIRDTNWLLFPANTMNCWNTPDYDGGCLTADMDIASGSYIIYKNNNRWSLSGVTIGGNYINKSYRDAYRVSLDANGLYTQSGGTTELMPLFTRELQISYPNGAQKMNIKVIVSWKDSSGIAPHTISLNSLLTNWKK